MIRVKLVEAREARGLKQKQLGECVGVTERTIRRWEHGERAIARHHRRALCDELGLSDADLDVFGVASKDVAASLVVEETPLLYNGLDGQLLTMVLLWPRNNTEYTLLQERIRALMEQSMDKHRRKAMELLSTLPISIFSLSPINALPFFAPDEVLPWLASGLVAANELGYGSVILS